MPAVLFNLLAFVTALSGALVVYHHLLYPLALARLAARRSSPRPAPWRRRYLESPRDRTLPSLTLVVPAFNEADVIADKVRNLATLDYPSDKLDVVIACDGCTDATADLARAAAAEPECRRLAVTVLEFQENRGKVAIVNDVVPRCGSDLVALSDASALISVDAPLLAAGHFSDPDIGVVCGTYRLMAPGSDGEAAYWRYQVGIKRREGAVGAPLGAHGAFYVFRRELFRPLPADTINDDFVLPMEIVARGWRSVYEPSIVALELERADGALDRRRRRRIAAGNVQQAIRLRRLGHPQFGGIAFIFLSGKALRAAMPLTLLTLFLGSLVLAFQSALFAAALGAQVLVYGLAVIRSMMPRRSAPKVVEMIHYLVIGHLAGLIGAVRYLLGLERGCWRRAAPSMESK